MSKEYIEADLRRARIKLSFHLNQMKHYKELISINEKYLKELKKTRKKGAD